MVTDYKIVFAEYLTEQEEDNLEGKVKVMMKEGWEPLGAPFIMCGADAYAQAMVKTSWCDDRHSEENVRRLEEKVEELVKELKAYRDVVAGTPYENDAKAALRGEFDGTP